MTTSSRDPGQRPVPEPLDIARGFVAAWNEHDGDEIARLFAPDADFVNVVGFHWRGRPAIARAHRRGFTAMFGASVQELTRMSVRTIGERAAVVHAHWRMTGQVDPSGNEAGQRRGVVTFVAERSGEGWLAVAAQNTDIVPGAETRVQLGDELRAASYLPGGVAEGRPLPGQD